LASVAISIPRKSAGADLRFLGVDMGQGAISMWSLEFRIRNEGD
jgi:hypothetical protein